MDPEKIHLRHCILYEFHQGKNAPQTASSICSGYGEFIVKARLCQRWFARFRTGNFSIEDQERPGRPRVMETDDLETLFKEDQRQSNRELVIRLNFDQTSA